MRPKAPISAWAAMALFAASSLLSSALCAPPQPTEDSSGKKTSDHKPDLLDFKKSLTSLSFESSGENIGTKTENPKSDVQNKDKDVSDINPLNKNQNNTNMSLVNKRISTESNNNYERNTEKLKDITSSSLENKELKKYEDIVGMSQHFFPSFAPLFPPSSPLNPSYPYLFQEQAHSHRPPLVRPQHNVFQPLTFGGPTREQKYIQAQAQVPAHNAKATGVLGSGNFGVIRGGTFYGDNRGDASEYGSIETHNAYVPFYHNGHGKPDYYNGANNPRPQHHHGNDFFANFRDFADINTPTKASYSEIYVVYMKKNATNPFKKHQIHKKLTQKTIINPLPKSDKVYINTPKKISNKRRELTEEHFKKKI